MTQFDAELKLVIKSLDDETRREMMAFFVSETLAPSEIADTLKADYSRLHYHATVLNEIGAIEEISVIPRPNGSLKHVYAATELGHLAYAKLTGDGTE